MLDINSFGALGLLIEDTLAEALAPLSPSAASTLLSLHYHGPLTATELASIISTAQPTGVRVLDGLARQGLVARMARDGRKTPFHLTDEGRRQAKALQKARMKALNGLLTPLSGQEREMFKALADRLLVSATTSRRAARTLCRLCDHTICDGPLCPVGCRVTALEQEEG